MKNIKKTLWFIATEIHRDRAGSFRQARWARLFLNEGYNVYIINYSYAWTFSALKFTTVSELEKFRKTSLIKNKSRSGVRQGIIANILRWLKHSFFVDFLNIGAVRACLYLRAQRMNNQHVIMSSSPPISSILIAYLTKLKHRDVYLINDLRDAWALHPAIGGNKKIKMKLEKKLLEAADCNITVSNWLKKEFEAIYRLKDFNVAYNVSDYYSEQKLRSNLSNICDIIIPFGYKIIVYTGSIPKGHFDLLSFTCAVKNRIKNSRFPYVFLCIGNCLELKKIVQHDTSIKNYFIFIDHLPNKKVITYQNLADILLFFGFNADGNAGVVSTKFFEYLYLKKPILAVNVKADSDVSHLLEKYCGRTINIENETQIYDLLSRNFEDELPELKIDRDELICELIENYSKLIQAIPQSNIMS